MSFLVFLCFSSASRLRIAFIALCLSLVIWILLCSHRKSLYWSRFGGGVLVSFHVSLNVFTSLSIVLFAIALGRYCSFEYISLDFLITLNRK